MLQQIFLLYHTTKYLKTKQIYYRLFYFIRKKYRKITGFKYPFSIKKHSQSLYLATSIPVSDYFQNATFVFLNLSKDFEQKIDWNYKGHGKLWTYNLNYFDYLNQDKLDKRTGVKLIQDYIDNYYILKDGLEPYPISLRGINWIKFFSTHKINNDNFNSYLYHQYTILYDNIEYHLLGNHLLENGFSLLFGAYYFNDNNFYNKAVRILKNELKEQILLDGAHFELSPMYHQIILFRLLDCYNLVLNNYLYKKELIPLLTSAVARMLNWLEAITFKDGSIPLVNDAVNNIAPDTNQLISYAERLGIQRVRVPLKESGYRKVIENNYELLMDVGNIGPDYIPGHAHSDTFSFVLHVNKQPVIIDTGISTYETNARRLLERQTQSHNTVQIENFQQSEVWGSFRVARRAKVKIISENYNYIKAAHTGYKKINASHEREFKWKANNINIIDSIGNNEMVANAFIHFNADVIPILIGNKVAAKAISIEFENADEIFIEDYFYATEFNKLIPSKKLRIQFKKELKTFITL